MTGPAALKVAVVGPTHPTRAASPRTTTLAHELAEAGHDVTLVSWSHLYPSRLYPGEQAVPGGAPDVEPFPRTVRALSWARPDTWCAPAGGCAASTRRRRPRHPAVIPAHLALLRAAGIGRRGGGGRWTSVGGHRAQRPAARDRPGDSELMRSLLGRGLGARALGRPARLAHDLGALRVSVADLPPHLPGGAPVDRPEHNGPTRLSRSGSSASTRASTCSSGPSPRCPARPSPWQVRCGGRQARP